MIVGHPEAGEDGLVQLPFDHWRCTRVEAMGVGAKQEDVVHCSADLFDLQRVLLNDLAGVGDLPVDALLLRLEQVERYGIGIAGLDELVLLVTQVSDAPLLPVNLGLSARLATAQFGVNQFTDRHETLDFELDARPMVGDLRLDVSDQHGPLRAGLGALSAEAVEVRVNCAPAVARVSDAEPVAAVAAVHAAFQEVRVLLGLLTGLGAAGADGLHAFEGHEVDECRMAAVVLDAFERHEAEVVAVGEHLVDVLHADGPAGALWRGRDAEPTAGQLNFQLAQSPLAVGVGVEHPLDEWRTVWVDGDGTDFPAVDLLAHVLVAERGESRGAAHDRLLSHAFLGLEGQVGAVELGDGAHDAVQEAARRRGIDVLGRGHQLRTGLADGQVDGDIIFSGTSQPVDLMDDRVVDAAALLDEPEHGLELRTVGTFGGLTAVAELGDDHGVEAFGSALVGVALGGQ